MLFSVITKRLTHMNIACFLNFTSSLCCFAVMMSALREELQIQRI